MTRTEVLDQLDQLAARIEANAERQQQTASARWRVDEAWGL